MLSKRSRFSYVGIAALAALAATQARADISEVLTETEDALQNQNQSKNQNQQQPGQQQPGVDAESMASEKAVVSPLLENISVSDLMMMMTPSVNNLGASAPQAPTGSPLPGHHHGGGAPGSSGGGFGGRGSNYMVRDVVEGAYKIDSTYSIGPVFNVMDPLSGPTSGYAKIGDPQVRLMIHDPIRGKIANNDFGTSFWVAYSVPISTMSREQNSYGGISLTAIPHLRFHHSRFSLGGVASTQTSIYGEQAGVVGTYRFFGGVQGCYQVSRPVQLFVMQMVNVQAGPDIEIDDPTVAAEAFAHQRGQHELGASTGVKLDASKMISVSPRVMWFYDQPMNQATIGLSAMIHLI